MASRKCLVKRAEIYRAAPVGAIVREAMYLKIILKENATENFKKFGVRVSVDPKRYPCLLNMVGRNRKKAFHGQKDRMRRRVNSWCVRPLFQGGKEVFIKSVLQAIPTFTMSCFLLPTSLYKKLKQVISRFWW
ncbi:reverse transcriptase [Gossypium australe]|uniref:Reverse transcriptase n=1 Tax=Gossypium australe TaxID=47621 RepID=A0A5B6V0L1_9ROSI|nr:reverse transcriptase [Gossypium australe]